MSHFKLCTSLMIVSLAVSTLVQADEKPKLPDAVNRPVDYAKHVAPIFKTHCLKCHGPTKQEGKLRLDRRAVLLRGGESGEPAIVPAKSADSLLVKAIAGLDANVEMPPEGPRVTKDQIAIIRAWIDQGAKMGDDTGSEKLTTDQWSFQPLAKAAPPKSSRKQSNAIDGFVERKLKQNGLAASSQATKRTLLRRLHLVMHGLPPTQEQADRFLNDKSPDAWKKLVDRVLESPRYGERFARHWLDLVRFGETTGFEVNRERPNAWPYRDYVIDAFNSDKPFDQFVREQIAGDASGADVATSFLVAGPYDQVKSPDINLTLMQRQDELGDIINTTGTAFMGLTLGCARCHNHKFDPITQRDYYSIQAIFAGVKHGERTLPVPEGAAAQIAELDKRRNELTKKLAEFIPISTAGVVLIDDKTIFAEGSSGLELLVKPEGYGKNPAGIERGHKNDPGTLIRSANLSQGEYTWWTNKPGEIVGQYHPVVRGSFRVWLSWGVGWSTHTKDASFLLDVDGDITTTADQTQIAHVNQQGFLDAPDKLLKKALWSGFYNAGIHELLPQSTILIQGGKTGTAITLDTLLLEPVNSDRGKGASDANGSDQAPTKPLLRPSVTARHNVEVLKPVQAKFVRFSVQAASSSQPCIDELQVWSGQQNVGLATHGTKPTASSELPGYPIHKIVHINDGKFGNSHSWISNENGAGWIQLELPKIETIDRIEWARDRSGLLVDRLATSYKIEVATKIGEWQTVASSADRVPFKVTKLAVAYRFDGVSAERAKQGQAWLAELAAANQKRQQLSQTQRVYAGVFGQPGSTHRLYRGDPLAKREEVKPDALEVIGTLQLTTTSPEQQRRVAFAKWLTDPKHPLVARVIVNRLWQYQFGIGLVDTPSDFGANGTQPTHPELLDWLALELIKHDWSLKHIQRLILMSATWQQTSVPNEQAMAVDADTRLLWRFAPRRLEAEAIRDSMLAASGVIDFRMGGPGFSGFQVQMENVRHYFPKTKFDASDWRRMIYMTKVRQEQDSVFGAFDCPDASQVMPKRSRSTTPLQALNLLNSAFMLQQADLLSKRLAKNAKTQREQVRLAFRYCYSRIASDEEVAEAEEFTKKHGLSQLSRALLNSNEFLFIE